MQFSKYKKERIKDAFTAAYHGKKSDSVAPDFPQKVMRRIRQLNIDDNNLSYTMLFEKLLWRMAPVAICAGLILSAVIMSDSVTPRYEMVYLAQSDPIAYDFIQFYGK